MSNWHTLTRQKKVVDVIADGHLFVHRAYLRDFKIMSIICLSSCMTLSRWAVFKTPLLFHYTGWLIGIPLLDYYNPNILGSISQLIICPARGFEHFSGVPTDSSMANPQVPSVPRSLPSCAMCARSSWQSCSTAGPKKTPQRMSITMVQQRPQGIRHKWWQLSSIWWWEYHSMGNIIQYIVNDGLIIMCVYILLYIMIIIYL